MTERCPDFCLSKERRSNSPSKGRAASSVCLMWVEVLLAAKSWERAGEHSPNVCVCAPVFTPGRWLMWCSVPGGRSLLLSKIKIKENQTNQKSAEGGRDAEQMVKKGETSTEAMETLEERGRKWQEESAGKGIVGEADRTQQGSKTPWALASLLCLPSLLLRLPSA